MSNTIIGKIVMILLALTAISILVLTDFGNSRQHRIYDCTIAEFHPDYPKEVKEECRRLILEKYEETKPRQYI